MKRATCSERRRGFTLLEMLVAITLLAVMAVIGWRALDSMTRSRERLIDHDARLDALKVLYGQFQSDCEHLASADLLQASPVEIGNGQVLMVRDRREENQPPMWQALSYRLDGNALVRLAAPPVDSRAAVQSALLGLRQAGRQSNVQVRRVLSDVDSLGTRVWIDPQGWLADNGRIRSALFNPSSSNANASSGASAVAAPTPTSAVVRAVELSVQARMGDGDAPRNFLKICMTGL
jgi:general secretion pathway protein J